MNMKHNCDHFAISLKNTIPFLMTSLTIFGFKIITRKLLSISLFIIQTCITKDNKITLCSPITIFFFQKPRVYTFISLIELVFCIRMRSDVYFCTEVFISLCVLIIWLISRQRVSFDLDFRMHPIVVLTLFVKCNVYCFVMLTLKLASI